MGSKPTIGLLGLGLMGLAMAKNAKKRGYGVVAFNRSKERQDQGKNAGLEILESPKEVASRSEAIIVMVTDPAAVRSVLTGTGGLFEGHVENKTLIQMSTIDKKSTLSFYEQAQSHGMKFLDCPVAGSKKQVEAAELIILAGGGDENLGQWKDLLLSMGKHIVHAGEVGMGTALKLCMNLIVAQMTTALCEGVALAKVQGLELQKIFEVLDHSPALKCGYFGIKKEAILSEDFSPAFSLENMLKDVRFMDQVAKENRLPLPVNLAVKFLMESALAEGLGKEDLTSMIKILRPKVQAD